MCARCHHPKQRIQLGWVSMTPSWRCIRRLSGVAQHRVAQSRGKQSACLARFQAVEVRGVIQAHQHVEPVQTPGRPCKPVQNQQPTNLRPVRVNSLIAYTTRQKAYAVGLSMEPAGLRLRLGLESGCCHHAGKTNLGRGRCLSYSRTWLHGCI